MPTAAPASASTPAPFPRTWITGIRYDTESGAVLVAYRGPRPGTWYFPLRKGNWFVIEFAAKDRHPPVASLVAGNPLFGSFLYALNRPGVTRLALFGKVPLGASIVDHPEKRLILLLPHARGHLPPLGELQFRRVQPGGRVPPHVAHGHPRGRPLRRTRRKAISAPITSSVGPIRYCASLGMFAMPYQGNPQYAFERLGPGVYTFDFLHTRLPDHCDRYEPLNTRLLRGWSIFRHGDRVRITLYARYPLEVQVLGDLANSRLLLLPQPAEMAIMGQPIPPRRNVARHPPPRHAISRTGSATGAGAGMPTVRAPSPAPGSQEVGTNLELPNFSNVELPSFTRFLIHHLEFRTDAQLAQQTETLNGNQTLAMPGVVGHAFLGLRFNRQVAVELGAEADTFSGSGAARQRAGISGELALSTALPLSAVATLHGGYFGQLLSPAAAGPSIFDASTTFQGPLVGLRLAVRPGPFELGLGALGYPFILGDMAGAPANLFPMVGYRLGGYAQLGHDGRWLRLGYRTMAWQSNFQGFTLGEVGPYLAAGLAF